MTVAQLKDNLCKDLIVGSFERHDRKFLVTRFTYPIGDSVNLYLIGDDGEQRITDLGTTHYFLKVANVEMDTEARMEFVKSVCAGFHIEIGPDLVLSKPISVPTAKEDVLGFCEAITRISALHYDQKARQFQSFATEVDTLITRVVPPGRFYKGWTDPAIDPDSNYLIDYHFNSLQPARNIFVVRGRLGAETAIGTMNFYLAKNRLDESMSVVAPELGLPRRVERKLEMTSRVIFGMDEKEISKFAIRE
jgi:hypothetical protein